MIMELLMRTALDLVGRLVYDWVKQGRDEIKVSEVATVVAREAKIEADRLRIRVDDLERQTMSLLDQLASSSPLISYERKFAAPRLHLNYDPKNAESSRHMLDELRMRISEIEVRESGVRHTPEPIEATEPVLIIEDREVKPPQSKSVELLEELKERVRNAESTRS
jgi:hypothetical protein